MGLDKSEKSFLKKIIPAGAFIGGLCCFTPLVLVLLGVSTVTYAASLSNFLYGDLKWVFRGIAILFLVGALFWYFYKKEGVCSFDAVKRKRTKIINLTLITLISAIIIYVIWLYVVVDWLGDVFASGIW